MAILTVFPAAGANSPVDGLVTRYGVDESLATIRAGLGIFGGATDANESVVRLRRLAGTTSGNLEQIVRGIFLFDTSALGINSSVTAATASFYVLSTINDFSGANSANSVMVLVASTPASNSNIVLGDYGQLGSVDFGRSAQQDGLTTSAYNDITINATGLTDISKTGITKYGLKYGWDIDNTTTGLTLTGITAQQVNINYADTAGTTTDPKLVITYTTTFKPRLMVV